MEYIFLFSKIYFHKTNRGDVNNMLFKKNNDTEPNEAAEKNNTIESGSHRDAVSPSERAIIAAASGDTSAAKAVTPHKAVSMKYDYLNAPIVKSRPCPLCGEHLEADTIFCPKCNNRVVSRYDEALILRRQGKELPKEEKKPTAAVKTEPKPAPAAPVKPVAPKAEPKPVTAAPVKAAAPKAEFKPAPAAPVKTAAPKVEPKPAPAKPAAPKAEPTGAFSKPAPLSSDKPKKKPASDDPLVIKVRGSGYTKHEINPHFTTADDFDD